MKKLIIKLFNLFKQKKKQAVISVEEHLKALEEKVKLTKIYNDLLQEHNKLLDKYNTLVKEIKDIKGI